MPSVAMTRETFLNDSQGRTFADVLNDPNQPFDAVLAFFNDDHRQQRMEDAEIHHDRPAMAGVVREFESQPDINQFLAQASPEKGKRLRQAIGVVVRMIMEGRGWKKTGRKGSLGVRAAKSPTEPYHNKGGLAFWFVRAERYERPEGMPFRSVRARCLELDADSPDRAAPDTKTRRPGGPTSQAGPAAVGRNKRS